MELYDYRLEIIETRGLDGGLSSDADGLAGARRLDARLLYAPWNAPEVTVGHLSALVIEIDGDDPMMVCDSLSQELMNVAETVFDHGTGWLKAELDDCTTTVIVESVELNPRFRGKGLGPLFLTAFLEHAQDADSFTMAALQASPMQGHSAFHGDDEPELDDEQWTTAQKKIAKAWESVGFTVMEKNIYVLDLQTTKLNEAAMQLRAAAGVR